MASSTPRELESHLAHFGLSSFRPGQEEVVSAILQGRDSLCIMPTGGGKSLCFQLPAVARPGVTLVISPLIALMKDQVDSLQALQIRATYVNSSLPYGEQCQRLAAVANGDYDLVYVAPERLRNPRFLEAVRPIQLQLLAVDEAHCISEWGHDFRPDYSRLGGFRRRLGNPQTIALTATATADVRHDVIQQLGLRDPYVCVTGFARPSLRFEVVSPASTAEKNAHLLSVLRQTPGAGIVYASTRRRCEELRELLETELHKPVGLYHAGLLPDDRRDVQEAFMRGEVAMIVATNAFGMGIDKSDLRFVVHYNMPGTLEAYYQEAGRAGRDGKLSRCVLLFSYADRYLQEFFIENAYPTRDMVRNVYEYLRSRDEDPIEMTLQEIKERLGLSIGAEGIGACERLLEKCGAMERLSSQQNMASVKLDSDLPTLVDLLPKEARLRRKVLRVVEQDVNERRYEWVYFPPQRLAASLGIERDALSRALRELTKLPAFDYVPPFRGRAIHMPRRDRPFGDLEIDFDELKRRRQAEMEKLDRVIRYARTRRCRQLEILDYFGDRQPKKCQICDNCEPGNTPPSAITATEGTVDEAILEAIRMALSGAARTRGRVGKGLLVKMLGGSESAQVRKLQLHRLSTFGLLSDLKQRQIAQLVDALLEIGLLEQVERQRLRPIVQITELGEEVMRGQTSLDKPLPLSFELLASLRARHSRGVRRPDATRRAQTPPIPTQPVTDPAGDTRPTQREPTGNQCSAADRHIDASSRERPSHYWTWRLLMDNYDLDECTRIRRVDEATALDHLLRAAEEGREVRPMWFLSPEQIVTLDKIIGPTRPRQLRAVLDDLPPDIRYEQVQLYLACRGDQAVQDSK